MSRLFITDSSTIYIMWWILVLHTAARLPWITILWFIDFENWFFCDKKDILQYFLPIFRQLFLKFWNHLLVFLIFSLVSTNYQLLFRSLLYQSFFFKVGGLRPATLLKKRLWAQLFSCEFCKISKSIFFYKTLLVAASV